MLFVFYTSATIAEGALVEPARTAAEAPTLTIARARAMLKLHERTGVSVGALRRTIQWEGSEYDERSNAHNRKVDCAV